MTTIEKFKYSSHTYMFFDGELFENFLKKEKKIEELTTKEDFYQFNEPMIGFITSNEYEMQTHGLTLENKKIHTKGNEIVDELFVSTTNFDDTNFNDVIKNIKLPNQTKINHSIGKINIYSKELIIYDDYKTSIKLKVPNGTFKVVELYDQSYIDNIKRERIFEKQYQDTYEGKYPKKYLDLFGELGNEIREYIYDEWDTWEPTQPNIHMLYINLKDNSND